MNKPRVKYVPPIPWERFNAMEIALYKRVHRDQPLDRKMALELYEVVRRLKAIYQSELDKSLPNRRVKHEDLKATETASLLMEWYGVGAVAAMEAATGKKYPRDVDQKIVERTLKRRVAKLRGDVYWPTPAELEAAIARLSSPARSNKEAWEAYRRARYSDEES